MFLDWPSDFDSASCREQPDNVEHPVVVPPETDGYGQICKVCDERLNKRAPDRQDLCACRVHGNKARSRVTALARVRGTVDSVVREVGPAVVEVMQLAGADFAFGLVRVEQGVVEAQVERHAPCVAAEVVALGEPGHGLGRAVVFGVVREERRNGVGCFFQVFEAACRDIEPGVVTGRFCEGAVEG